MLVLGEDLGLIALNCTLRSLCKDREQACMESFVKKNTFPTAVAV